MSTDSSKSHPARWDFGNPVSSVLAVIFIFLLSQIVAIVLTAAGYAAFGGHGNFTNILDQSVSVEFFYILIAEGLAVTWTIIAVTQWRKLPLAAIGLGRRPKLKDLSLAAGGILVFYGLVIAGSALLSFFVSSNDLNKQQDLGFNMLSSNLDHTLAFVSLVILPPLGEEILARGYLYSALRSRWSIWPAMIVTSILFGLAHLNGGVGGSEVWAAAFDTFILSMVLVIVRERSNALYAGMLIHATNNLVAFGIHFK